MKLTKAEIKAHGLACEYLQQDALSIEQREYVLENWHPGANHINSAAGAFFTPTGLASDFTLEIGPGRTIDLCAGIGALAYHTADRHHHRYSDERHEIVCVEINPDYVAVGKKILPEATWICADVFDLPDLGHFDNAISNPPFGATPRRSGHASRYTGSAFEFHVIDIASQIADRGAFIIPQMSAGFRFSGVRCYDKNDHTESSAYKAFRAQTGLELSAGIGIDCAFYRADWKGVAPSVEIACCDFEEQRAALMPAPVITRAEPHQLALFA